MSTNHDEKNEYKQFLPDDEFESDRIVFEVPADPQPLYDEKVPNGYDPMGEIYLRGRASRGLAGGNAPWWVLISGWVLFGGFALLILIPVIASANFQVLPVLIIACIPIIAPLIILWRGTTAKLSRKKQKSKRR